MSEYKNVITESSLRHHVHNAEDRYNSLGEIIPGNGLAPAIIRIGRKLLIDLDVFDHWVESHRVSSVELIPHKHAVDAGRRRSTSEDGQK